MGNGKELRTHCGNGHEYTPENTYINSAGARCCRACKREWHRRKKGLNGRPKNNKNQNTGKTHCKRGHEFTVENTQMKGTRRVCRECNRLWAQEDRKKANKKLTHKQVKRKSNLGRLGWSLELFDKVFKEQEGKCAICKILLYIKGQPNGNGESNIGMACADHEHSGSPIPRGILCSNCNTGIGLLKENPEIMRAAIEYVLKYKKEG